jgi:hypothetical protein
LQLSSDYFGSILFNNSLGSSIHIFTVFSRHPTVPTNLLTTARFSLTLLKSSKLKLLNELYSALTPSKRIYLSGRQRITAHIRVALYLPILTVIHWNFTMFRNSVRNLIFCLPQQINFQRSCSTIWFQFYNEQLKIS